MDWNNREVFTNEVIVELSSTRRIGFFYMIKIYKKISGPKWRNRFPKKNGLYKRSKATSRAKNEWVDCGRWDLNNN